MNLYCSLHTAGKSYLRVVYLLFLLLTLLMSYIYVAFFAHILRSLLKHHTFREIVSEHPMYHPPLNISYNLLCFLYSSRHL